MLGKLKVRDKYIDRLALSADTFIVSSDVRVVLSAVILISVAASSDGDSSVTYQWYKAELADGTNAARLIGETKNTLTIPKELTEGEHYFFCKITADGVNTQRSEVATVTVA